MIGDTAVDYGTRFVDKYGIVHIGVGKYGLRYAMCQYFWVLNEFVVIKQPEHLPQEPSCIRCLACLG